MSRGIFHHDRIMWDAAESQCSLIIPEATRANDLGEYKCDVMNFDSEPNSGVYRHYLMESLQNLIEL